MSPCDTDTKESLTTVCSTFLVECVRCTPTLWDTRVDQVLGVGIRFAKDDSVNDVYTCQEHR